ncbi:20421_t:CDS:2, partial [Racocetra persica]
QVEFEKLYIQGVTGGRYLTGEGARGILLRSKLPSDALAKIWTLSNVTANEYLTFPEFALAMYLTSLKLKGQELPNKLPDSIFNEQQFSGLSMVPSVSQYSSVPANSGISVMPGMVPFTQRMMPQQNPQQQYSTAGLQGNAKIPWAVTQEEKNQYRAIFRQWDSTGLGYLT